MADLEEEPMRNLLHLALACLCVTLVAYTEESVHASNTIAIAHSTKMLQTLPHPGKSVPLNVQLQGTRNAKFLLKTEIVRDGRRFQIDLPHAVINAYDQPEYKVEIIAPVLDVSYRFTLIDPSGKVVTRSSWHYLRRNCVPRLALANMEIEEQAPPSQKASTLREYASQLEEDIESYDNALLLLQELSPLVGKR